MESCNLFCQSSCGINWWWFAAAVIVAFGIGALWYSVLFAKAWVRVFRVEMEKPTTGSLLCTMFLQLVATAVFGLVFFVLTNLSICIAVLALIGFCAWEKGNLKFEFADMRDFIQAVCIRVGYTFVAGIIFILFALM